VSDLRGALLPLDSRSHITRINDWVGSGSWVEGCRRDAGERLMAQVGEKHPYLLTVKAFYEGRMMPAGSMVFLHPAERGYHHAPVPGHEYPTEAGSTIDANALIHDLSGQVAQLTQDIEALHRIIADRDEEIATLLSAREVVAEEHPKGPE